MKRKILLYLGFDSLSLKETQDKYLHKYINQAKPVQPKSKLPISVSRSLERVL